MGKSEVLFVTVLGIIIVGTGFLLYKYPPDFNAQGAVVSQQPEKPATKTRCDFTGLLASQIIAEEAKNGYRFNGRVNTFLCGENGLSFSLEEL